ncbi:MAG: hypothetical protein ACK57E_12220 [Erythrobacteraceae bacterium]
MIDKTAALLGASLAALAFTAPALANDHAPAHEHGIETLAEGEAAAPALPTMSFGSWGFEPALLATDIKPGDDFNAYANKRGIDVHPLPPEFSRIGAFVLLGEHSC